MLLFSKARVKGFFAGAALVLLCTGPQAAQKELKPHSSPKAVPPVVFLDPSGRRISLDSYRGKVVLLNFWRTSCSICVSELPAFKRLQEDLGPGVSVVNLSVGKETPQQLYFFLGKNSIEALPPFSEPTETFYKAVSVESLPTTLVVDARGREVARIVGAAEWRGPFMKAQIKSLIPKDPAPWSRIPLQAERKSE